MSTALQINTLCHAPNATQLVSGLISRCVTEVSLTPRVAEIKS